jgi:CRP/FNR family transcriptional regulator, dissimilatory nitrate respiration regulator
MTKFSDLRDAALIYSLRSASIFAGLPEDELRQIAGYAVIKPLRKGEYLFRERDSAIGFYIVRKGIINVHRVSADGREQVIHLFRPGESFAEAALAGDSGYPADARAVENSEVILIPKQEFMAHQRDHIDLAWRMLGSMSQHLRVLVFTLDGLKLKDAETRFLHWVLRRCPRPLTHESAGVEIGMTKAVLASELGTRQETLSRIFAKLRDAKVLEVKQSAFVVPDPLALQEVFEKNLSGIPGGT